MKKLIALFLVALFLFMIGCSDKAITEDFVVLDASESYLLVAKIGEDGQVMENMQYSVPNYFDAATDIQAGNEITIKHNGISLETYPMQFAEIYQMVHFDEEGEKTATVTPD